MERYIQIELSASKIELSYEWFLHSLTFCRFAMGGLFTSNVYTEHETQGYNKTVFGARNPAYCKCAVSGCRSCPTLHILFV